MNESQPGAIHSKPPETNVSQFSESWLKNVKWKVLSTGAGGHKKQGAQRTTKSSKLAAELTFLPSQTLTELGKYVLLAMICLDFAFIRSGQSSSVSREATSLLCSYRKDLEEFTSPAMGDEGFYATRSPSLAEQLSY